MKPLTRCAFCLFACVCCLFVYTRAAHAQQAVWLQKSISLKCKDSSFTQALEQVATQANISIMADGLPLPRTFTSEARLPVEKALTQIAEAFDCAWSVSKSGIVLLRKRFTDEHERPQVAPAEMRTAVHDILSFMLAVYTPQPHKSLSDSFRALEANLPPDALKSFHLGEGAHIDTLPPDLQRQAVQIVLQNQLDVAALNFDRFEKQLAALPDAVVKSEDILFVGGVTHPYLVLSFNPTSGLQRDLLYRTDEEKSETANTPPADTMPRFEKPLTLTVEQALTLLDKKFHLTVTPPPGTSERRVTLKLQDVDASHLPAALAELYGWTLQQPDARTFLLSRRPVAMPPTVMEWGSAIQQALPSDVARWLTTKPATINGKVFANPEELYPQLPKTGGFTMSVISSKMFIQLRDTKQDLRSAAQNEDFAQPRQFDRLDSELQREIVYHLFYFAITQAQDGLLPFIFHVPNIVADPLHARLSSGINGFRIMGAGDGSVQITE